MVKVNLDIDEELEIEIDDSRIFVVRGFRNCEGTLVLEEVRSY